MGERTPEDLELVWYAPPHTHGQIVEHAFASDVEGGRYLRRVTDRSDGSVTYSECDFDDAKEGWEPWSKVPELDWTEVPNG